MNPYRAPARVNRRFANHYACEDRPSHEHGAPQLRIDLITNPETGEVRLDSFPVCRRRESGRPGEKQCAASGPSGPVRGVTDVLAGPIVSHPKPDRGLSGRHTNTKSTPVPHHCPRICCLRAARERSEKSTFANSADFQNGQFDTQESRPRFSCCPSRLARRNDRHGNQFRFGLCRSTSIRESGSGRQVGGTAGVSSSCGVRRSRASGS
jgi:hypothetical protein